MTTAFTPKLPYEEFRISFDFTTVLGSEIIASVDLSAIDQQTLLDATSTILNPAKQANVDTIVYGWVQSGSIDHSYLITCNIVGSGGSKYSLNGVLSVISGAEEPTVSGTPLSTLITDIQGILQDAAYSDIVLIPKINSAVQNIAAGIRMPNGETSPPLVGLYTNAQLYTDPTLPYISLPVDYQREVIFVYDSTMYQILPPRGGDYYSYNRFLKQINQFDLKETGEIYRVAIKSRKLYYQGIPTASTMVGIHYYKKPDLLVELTDVPECIPEHLQASIITHYVVKEIFGEKIEDGQDNTGIGTKYHTAKFFEDMTDLIDFNGRDSAPMYYGVGGTEDRGACDG